MYGHPHFQTRKKAINNATPKNNSKEKIPEEWVKPFPILNEVHPGPDCISVVYFSIIQSLLHQGRIGSASAYQSSYTSFKAFRGNVRVCGITSKYLKEYEAWMINDKGNSKTTVGIYARALRAVLNEAIEQKLLSKDGYPFGKRKYGVPTGRNIKKALDQTSMANLYYAEIKKKNQQKGKDFWFFSFDGNGMNVKDIINLKYKNIHGEFLSFERAKTELTTRGVEPNIITCFITQDMWKIIDRWGNKDKDPENYIFPILKPGLSAIQQFKIKQNFTRFINKNMAKVSDKAKIQKQPKTMEARHTAATFMKNAGISPHFIKESLGHSTLKTTENYLGGFEDEQKKEFSKVIGAFKALHEQKLKTE